MGIQPAELLIPVDKRWWKLVKTVKTVKTTKRGLQLFRFLQSPPAFGVYPPPRFYSHTTSFKDWDGFWLGISHLKVLAVEYSIPTRANIVAKMANRTWVLLFLDACYSRG